MRNRNLLRLLVASALAGTASFCSAVSAGNGEVFVGAQLGGSSLAADTEGSGAASYEFEHGTTLSGSALVGYESVYFERPYRITGNLGHAKWNNARSLELLGGVDRLWRQDDGSGAVYIGPRLGVVRFSDDITDKRNTRLAWGIEAGALTALTPRFSPGGRPLSVGMFLRHTVIDARQNGVADNGLERDIRVRGQTSFGFQVLITL